MQSKLNGSHERLHQVCLDGFALARMRAPCLPSFPRRVTPAYLSPGHRSPHFRGSCSFPSLPRG